MITKTTSTSPGCLINPPADSKLLNSKPKVCVPAVLNTQLKPQDTVLWLPDMQYCVLSSTSLCDGSSEFISRPVLISECLHRKLNHVILSLAVSRNTQPCLRPWWYRWVHSVCSAVYSMLLCAWCCWGRSFLCVLVKHRCLISIEVSQCLHLARSDVRIPNNAHTFVQNVSKLIKGHLFHFKPTIFPLIKIPQYPCQPKPQQDILKKQRHWKKINKFVLIWLSSACHTVKSASQQRAMGSLLFVKLGQWASRW